MRDAAVQRDTSDALLWGTPYRTLRRLGGPGESEVLLAQEIATGKEVCVKIPRLEGREIESVEGRRVAGDRVRLEGDILKRLRHPNVASVLDVGQTPDGRPYFVTEPPTEERSLLELLAERGHLPAEEAVPIALDVVAALEAAHALGVIHRDVKPQNILLVERDGARRAVLADFGIAKTIVDLVAGPAPLAQPTAPGTRLGSPRYLSPELVLGQRTDDRSDLYQLGLVLFEMLSGKSPFHHHQRLEAVLLAQASEPPPPLSEALAEAKLAAAPPQLDAIVARCLAKEPANRYGSARELALALEGVLAQPAPPRRSVKAAWLGPSGTEKIGRAELEIEEARAAVEQQRARAKPRADTEPFPALAPPQPPQPSAEAAPVDATTGSPRLSIWGVVAIAIFALIIFTLGFVAARLL